MDFLSSILERKRREVSRRRAHSLAAGSDGADAAAGGPSRIEAAEKALRRVGRARVSVIAEIKMRSPSAGLIRERAPGSVAAIARAYVDAGASAVSVLCDGPGFGGTPLDLRRAASVVSVPLLFKEFVLDELQIELARSMGAHLVLLLARALSPADLEQLIAETLRRGLSPLVEIADETELEAALATGSRVIGVNARDLCTFRVDATAAARLVDRIPDDRIAVYMSGVSSREDLERLSDTRADAVLMGETLMRAASPGDRLRELLR